MAFKEEFLAQAAQFETLFAQMFAGENQQLEEETEVANLLSAAAETPEKADLIANLDNLVKVFNVVQLQSEMMSEFTRGTLSGAVKRLNSADEKTPDDLLPMLLFMQNKLIKLHDQLDFFFGNFEEEDLKKGFSIARRSAVKVSFDASADKERTANFVRTLKHQTLGYLKRVADLHDWLHGLLALIDKTLENEGAQGFVN
ncbi:MAG: hypothetical protein LBI11_04280 [Streptococcaceae bacterium]|jgi:hypothetical protein|nr:hypothetical protein [Streptococcaceae bacterium]